MKPKYYYYISGSKVEMLGSQFSKSTISKINPKIELAGFSISADINSQENRNQIKDLANLIEEMKKNELIDPLANIDIKEIPSRQHHFYIDESQWYTGLVSFGKQTSYVLWKFLKNYIFLLVGSPTNIIGDKFVDKEGASYRTGTPSLLENLFFFADITYENSVGYKDLNDNGKKHAVSLGDNAYDDIKDLQSSLEQKFHFISMDLKSTPEANSLGLGILCAKHLHNLPKMNIETVFTSFGRYRFIPPDDLPIWWKILKEHPSKEIREELVRCQGIVVGSPIYTAIS